MSGPKPDSRLRYTRDTPEFSRVANLSDAQHAVFAIAMTLLVLTLDTPVAPRGELVAGGMLMPDEVPPEAPAALWSVYLAVPDCEAAEQRAAMPGGTILRPTTEIGTGDKFAVVSDPTGATFQLMQPGA
jgi:uncharacterized glyoxalase superfamily protein PhnB